MLRAKRSNDIKFVRQAPIGNYIADFCCFSRHLIIEVDGGKHDTNHERDMERTRFLESKGFTVMRFWNNQVLGNLDGVALEIESALMDKPLTERAKERATALVPSELASPSPWPSPIKGEGGTEAV